jgi:hypothetical protein
MPAFRKPLIEARINEIIYHSKSRATSEILGAYSDGFGDGSSHERHLLIQRLREYEKDSIVAKLIAEMLAREEQES